MAVAVFVHTVMVAAVALVAVCLQGCGGSASSPAVKKQDIVQIAQSNPDLSDLVAAVVKADLAADLSQQGPFTVFAPNNASFVDLCKKLNKTFEEVLALPILKSILQYHVVPGRIFSTDLKGDQKVKSLDGIELDVKAVNGTVTVNDAKVITSDIPASNGVIHIIDAVLLPSSIVQIAQSNPDLSDLVAAVVKAQLAADLSQQGPFTVFAPINNAFAELCKILGKTIEEVLALPNLRTILQYHVVRGKILSTDLKASQHVASLGGSEVIVRAAGGKVTVNHANVIKADVLASNGVLHFVDAVLLPPAQNIVQIAQSDSGLSDLVAAVVKADLAADLSQQGPFTVFAPNNASFVDLCKKLNKTFEEVLALPTLKSILQYHVVSGRIFSSDLKVDQKVKSLEGSKLDVKALGGAVTVNDAKVIAADVLASNGVVHIIDAVLVPPAQKIKQIFSKANQTNERLIVV